MTGTITGTITGMTTGTTTWRPTTPALDTAGVWQLLRESAERTPDAVLVRDERRREVTYREIRESAERVAAGLLAQGIRPGTVVSWQLPSRVETIVLFFALSRLGAVQNPLIMMLREQEVGFIARQAGSRLLVVPSVFRGTVHGAMAAFVAADQSGLEVLVVDRDLPEGDPGTLPPEPPRSGPDGRPPVRWLFYTSGTTAEPKGAQHTDQGLLAAADTFCRAVAPVPADRTASLAPMAHVGGVLHVLSALATGSSILITDVFDPASTPEQLGEQRVTLGGSGVPFIKAYLQRQRQQPGTPMFPDVRAWLVGGSPRPPSFHTQVKTELGGVGVLSGYGLTECPYLSWAAVTDDEADLISTEGRPPAGTEVVVVRPDGSRAESGEVGELRVRAPQLTVGYVDAALDADAFDEDGYFRTGDLARIDARGYLTITGRIKDVIIRNMENISAREVEDRLMDFPGLAEVAVIGLPDDATGERVCAVVVPEPGRPVPTLAELCAHLADRGLNPRKLPVQVEVVEALPRNAMGKVMKPQLRSRVRDAAALDVPEVLR
ncbi:class I adenylate-forming enzyme family protein [uncultured Modestobacter sp.]|uniref:class I adenylate-forming enzyme family protein n=1 Tax=uncultured Modestobacter sp. TaxID=380048 RepID=UPI0026144F12|nr:AMP-binding protein [uncultured Modestobacter sp.]